MIQLVMVLHPMSTGVNQVRAGSLQPAVAINPIRCVPLLAYLVAAGHLDVTMLTTPSPGGQPKPNGDQTIQQ